ncbi:GINS complex subunit [Vanrija albida]|uniref:GINS complex subunit n=1 Tax=Vanrija albida TaxID=181172 RepID=A0ABR3QE95_9TREE
MSSFFDDDDEPFPQAAQAGSSRAGSAAPGRFLTRLSSIAGTPAPGFAESEAAAPMDEDAAAPEHSIFSAAELAPGAEEDALDDVRRLARVWVRERGVPGLLGWEGDLLDSLLDRLEQQQSMLDTLRADPQTSEEEHFRLVLVQTEMERAKYLVRSYVRVRLHKHILATPDLHALLSGAELAHAHKYADLLGAHYAHSVLDSLPEWLRRVDESYGDGVSMVTKPNDNTPVLVLCRKDCGEVMLEHGDTAYLAEGTTHLVRYHLVERWIALGWAEVL